MMVDKATGAEEASLHAQLARFQRFALGIGIVGFILSGIGIFTDPTQFIRSYLFAYLFWVGIALGCLAVLMGQYLTRNRWGIPLRRLLEAGSLLMLPLLAVLFLPLAFGLRGLYPWANPAVAAADPLIQHKIVYLNGPFFVIRAAVYFVVWLIFAYLFYRGSSQQDRREDIHLGARLQTLSVIGLVVFSLVGTLALTDWIMSLEPDWTSTIYAMTIAFDNVIAALALILLVLTRLIKQAAFAAQLSPQGLADLGSLILGGLMFWAYLAFSQFIVIYAGNLSDEIPWYIRRLQGGWEWVALAIAVFNFLVPFFALFSSKLKRNPQQLALVAAMVVIMHAVDGFWLIMPAFYPTFHISWLDIALLVGMGGFGSAVFMTYLKYRPLIARYPAGLELVPKAESLAHG